MSQIIALLMNICRPEARKPNCTRSSSKTLRHKFRCMTLYHKINQSEYMKILFKVLFKCAMSGKFPYVCWETSKNDDL